MAEDCIICSVYENDPQGKTVVEAPNHDNIASILSYAKQSLSYGESKFKPLTEFMETYHSDALKDLRYHVHCRKKVSNSQLLNRAKKRRSYADDSKSTGAPKKGRPAKSDPVCRNKRLPACPPKAKVCVFAPCRWVEETLSKVVSDERGDQLLCIKNNTSADKIRIALATLEIKGDASAQELYYHVNCIRDAERTCKVPCNPHIYQIYGRAANFDLIAYVKSSLNMGDCLNMKTLNQDYIKLLRNHGVADLGNNYKKHIKDIISSEVQNIVCPP